MADGGSTDRTRELLSVADAEARVRVLDNPGRTAPAALNVAIATAKGDIVTRVDGTRTSRPTTSRGSSP